MAETTTEQTRTLRCRQCGAVLGTMTSKRLSIGGVVVEDAVRLFCARCEKKDVWRPGRKAAG